MRYFLENNILKAEIDSHGAELKSVLRKDTWREYMWYGNPKYWNRTSPVLFPTVGNLKGKRFILNGKEYPMGQHGFARDMEFEPESELRDENGFVSEIWFKLDSSEETIAKYPYAFRLHLGYRLEEDRLKVLWRVDNPAGELLYFSIGAHPAFLVPVYGESSKTGYYLSFDAGEELHHYGNKTELGLATPEEDLILPLENGRVRITEDFFDRCTYMFAGRQTGRVSIEDPRQKPIVTLEFDTPIFAIWSPEKKNAPFICIEPWYGRCDASNYDGDFIHREYTQKLEPGQSFEAGYSIRYHRIG